MSEHTIVVVEDDHSILTFLDEVLTDEGYHTQLCSEGYRAFELISAARPDAVILDLWLGTSESGWTILDRMRNDRTTAHIPVIVCSADGQSLKQQAEHLAQQGIAILHKPFKLDALLQAVDSAVSARGPHTPA